MFLQEEYIKEEQKNLKNELNFDLHTKYCTWMDQFFSCVENAAFQFLPPSPNLSAKLISQVCLYVCSITIVFYYF